MSKLIIAVCGLAGSGKDTACDHLVAKHGFRKTSFAAPLKQMAKIAFGFTDEQLYGPSSKREQQDERYPFSGKCMQCGRQCRDHDFYGLEENDLPQGMRWECLDCKVQYPRYVNARLALQTLGTEWGRRLTPNIWANAAINQIMASDHERWCISDLRFQNEFDAVQRVAFRSDQPSTGKIVRLLRGQLVHQHASETELVSIPLSHFDMVINNLGELPEFYRYLDSMVEEFTKEHP